MAVPSEADHVARIVDRLRRDHPDPKIRQELYEAGGLPDYVRVLMQGFDDDAAVLDRVTAAVRVAEDGRPGPH